MREIKFRVWDKENNCWADIRHILVEQCSLPRMDGYFSFIQIFHHVYDNNQLVFQQFTGLLDKNGKEIFEGDLVEKFYIDLEGRLTKSLLKGRTSSDINALEVIYNQQHCSFQLSNLLNIATGKKHCYVIIGNIFENPELLEKPKE